MTVNTSHGSHLETLVSTATWYHNSEYHSKNHAGVTLATQHPVGILSRHP